MNCKDQKRIHITMNPSYLSVLVGTRTLGPLIKSQLLYQLSYKDVFGLVNIRNLAKT